MCNITIVCLCKYRNFVLLTNAKLAPGAETRSQIRAIWNSCSHAPSKLRPELDESDNGAKVACVWP